MSEWKELKIDNLPSDILVGDYEFEFSPKYSAGLCKGRRCTNNDVIGILKHIATVGFQDSYRYRKPEPKAPTHEEIMTKWWKTDKGDWTKPVCYNGSDYGLCLIGMQIYKLVSAKWFTGRKSADIPPEAES